MQGIVAESSPRYLYSSEIFFLIRPLNTRAPQFEPCVLNVTCPAPNDPFGVFVVIPTAYVNLAPDVSTVTFVATGTPATRVPREFGSVSEASMLAPPRILCWFIVVLDVSGQPDCEMGGF